MNSRGVLGMAMVTFFVTMFIVAILLMFVVYSGAVKTFSRTEHDVKVYGGSDDVSIKEVGLGDIYNYISNRYFYLVKVRLSVLSGNPIEVALHGGPYEK